MLATAKSVRKRIKRIAASQGYDISRKPPFLFRYRIPSRAAARFFPDVRAKPSPLDGTVIYLLDAGGKKLDKAYVSALGAAAREHGCSVAQVDARSRRMDFKNPSAFIFMAHARDLAVNSDGEYLKSYVSDLGDRFADAVIVCDPRSSEIIYNKAATNIALAEAGVHIPRILQSVSDGQSAFVNEISGSHLRTTVLPSGSTVPSGKYVTELIDTSYHYDGESYHVCLRIMAVGSDPIIVLVRARPGDNPNVHTRDTPLNPSLINHLYASLVVPNFHQLSAICSKSYNAFGLGLFAHDVLPCRKTGTLFVCEINQKTHDSTFVKHFHSIRQSLIGSMPMYNGEFYALASLSLMRQISSKYSARVGAEKSLS